MIGKVCRGKSVGGLIRYLYSPGNGHENPRVVAGWDEAAAIEPRRTASGAVDFRALIDQMNVPVAGSRAPTRCVWHCPLRTAPEDRNLTDAEWADVAAEVMDRTGLARRGEEGACRWVAVRHGDDHVHLVVTLARQDGRRVSLHNDFYRVGEACRAVEARYGLRVTGERDRTAAVRPTRAETEKAGRKGEEGSVRELLRGRVQLAAASTSSPPEFFEALRDGGVMVFERYSERDPSQVTGYSVAWPRSEVRTREGEPLRFGGGKLAADLTLPKLRARWDEASQRPGPAATHEGGDAEESAVQGAPTVKGATSAKVRLRYQLETAAAASSSTSGYFERLRESGVMIRVRYSERDPAQVTGYSVGLDSHRDAGGAVIWHGAGKLVADLSYPRLEERWGEGKVRGGRPTRLSAEERQQVLSEAEAVVNDAAEQVRRGTGGDDAARAAADVLNVAARVADPNGTGALSDAARRYDRASRAQYGRAARPAGAGSELRMTSRALALLAMAGRGEGAAVVALMVALAGLIEAVGELRATQGRVIQAQAARAAAEPLRVPAAVGGHVAAGRGPTPQARPTAVATPLRRPPVPPPQPPRPTR